jgi:hypothetical protein
MTLHSVIGILVAVAVPLWLVVEQVLLTWRVLEPRRSPSPARTEKSRPSKAAVIPDRRRDVTRPALHRKAS